MRDGNRSWVEAKQRTASGAPSDIATLMDGDSGTCGWKVPEEAVVEKMCCRTQRALRYLGGSLPPAPPKHRLRLPADELRDMDIMDILLTVDTELSPGRSVSTPAEVVANVRGSFYGVTSGEGGLYTQLELLRQHGLKAVFFVEALASLAVGDEPIREVADLLIKSGQEVQLHVHTEWLALARHNPIGDKCGQNMRDFSESDQARIIQIGKKTLMRCGVENIWAFRAGNYGADNATLRALAANDIRFDSSYNYPYLGHGCSIKTDYVLTQAARIEGVIEVPVTFFQDWPGHVRHAQICACSFGELSHMLLDAYAAGFKTFVIVCHSFELINRARSRVNRLLVRRFRRLCEFLDRRRDIFTTVGFNDLNTSISPPPSALVSPPHRTIGRYAEQLTARIYE